MARSRAKDPKQRQEIRKRRTGMILSFLFIFLLILLSSSFILRYIYRGAGNVEITPEGILTVYQAAIGDVPFNEDVEEENEDEEEIEEYEVTEPERNYTDGSGVYNNSGDQNSTNNSTDNNIQQQDQQTNQNNDQTQNGTTNQDTNGQEETVVTEEETTTETTTTN